MVINDLSVEVNILRNIELDTLRKFVGETIVTAVDTIYDTNLELILAELLILKYETALLESKEIRLSLLDTLGNKEIQNISSFLGKKFESKIEAVKWLYKYFSTSYSYSKSKEFADFFGLPDKYYKKELTDERLAIENIHSQIGEVREIKPYLHQYQKDVKDQILNNIQHIGSRVMVQMPTGAGKTYTALETVVDILRVPFQKNYVVWIVNTNELAEQALQSFHSLWELKGDRPLKVYRFFKDFKPKFSEHSDGGVVFTSYSLFYSALKDTDHECNNDVVHLYNNTEYLIVDEAHAAIADTYEYCIRAFLNNDITKVVGLSATPSRVDPFESEALKRLFSSNIISIRDSSGDDLDDPIKYLQNNSYLAHVNVETLDSELEFSGGDEASILKDLSMNSKRNEIIIKQIEHANNIEDKTLVFACSKDHVLALYILCKSKSMNVSFVTGDTPQSERISILDEFNRGDVNILINLEILSTGIDLPNVNRLIVTRPVRSPILYSQMVGRALRGPLNGGNKSNTVVNILDNIHYFSGLSLLYNSFKGSWE